MHLSVTVDAEPLARAAARTIARRRLALHVLVHGALAALVLVIGSRTLGPWWALAVLGAASAISERFPMPFPGKPGSTTSITPVFVLASGVLFGAPTAMLIGWLSMAIGRLSHRQPVRGRSSTPRSSRSAEGSRRLREAPLPVRWAWMGFPLTSRARSPRRSCSGSRTTS